MRSRTSSEMVTASRRPMRLFPIFHHRIPKSFAVTRRAHPQRPGLRTPSRACDLPPNPACSGLAALATDAYGYAALSSSVRAVSFQKLRVPCRAVTSSGVQAGWIAAPCGTSKALEAFSLFRISSSSRLNQRIYRVHAGASPARALRASGGLQFSSLSVSVVAPLAIHWRSTRRGTPRPCRSVMPGAALSRIPPCPMLPIGSGATARVRRPTLTTRPSSAHLRSQFTLPTAPSDRSRPHNPACSGLRFAALARR